MAGRDRKKVAAVQYRTENEAQTEALGGALAARLTAGSVVVFFGALGAGKTAFVRGIARALGYSGRVTSPTFTIVNEYEGGRLPLFHFDLYRLEGADALYDIGWEDYLARGGVCAVEWGERAAGALEDGLIRVEILPGESEQARVIRISEAYAPDAGTFEVKA